LHGLLNSIGIKTRRLALKTEDCETKEYGAGHVLVEAYLKERNKWILVDPQWNLIAVCDEILLHAVELQEKLRTGGKVEFKSFKSSYSGYEEWIEPYLFYFSHLFDNRVGEEEWKRSDGYEDLMLVPIGAKEPKVFQRYYPIEGTFYTNDIKLFYREPEYMS
jgi:hypothetical protein